MPWRHFNILHAYQSPSFPVNQFKVLDYILIILYPQLALTKQRSPSNKPKAYSVNANNISYICSHSEWKAMVNQVLVLSTANCLTEIQHNLLKIDQYETVTMWLDKSQDIAVIDNESIVELSLKHKKKAQQSTSLVLFYILQYLSIIK